MGNDQIYQKATWIYWPSVRRWWTSSRSKRPTGCETPIHSGNTRGIAGQHRRVCSQTGRPGGGHLQDRDRGHGPIPEGRARPGRGDSATIWSWITAFTPASSLCPARREPPISRLFAAATINSKPPRSVKRPLLGPRSSMLRRGRFRGSPVGRQSSMPLQLAQEQGKIISLDPNYSPQIWPDYREAMEVLPHCWAMRLSPSPAWTMPAASLGGIGSLRNTSSVFTRWVLRSWFSPWERGGAAFRRWQADPHPCPPHQSRGCDRGG